MKEIKFIPYAESEIGDYIDEVINKFTIALIKSGVEDAATIAEKKVIGEFFPERKLNDKQFVFHIKAKDVKAIVGCIWLAARGNNELRVADIHINEAHRRLGYGMAAMNVAHEFAIRKGFSLMSLNVFDENVNAKKMYTRLGYEVIEEGNGRSEMQKKLLNKEIQP